MNRLFHYTVGIYINNIIEEGKINLESDGGMPFKKQKPALWCTYSPKWEETCNKGMNVFGFHKVLDKKRTEKYCNGLYRIEIDSEKVLHDWDSWKKASNVSRDVAQKLKEIAEQNGSNVSLWRASFKPIRKRDWILIEKWNKKHAQWKEDTILMLALNQ